MFELWMCRRFLKPFQFWLLVLGVMTGVAVVIIANSLYRNYEANMITLLRGTRPHVQIHAEQEMRQSDAKSVVEKLVKHPAVAFANPSLWLEAKVSLSRADKDQKNFGSVIPVYIIGIPVPGFEKDWRNYRDHKDTNSKAAIKFNLINLMNNVHEIPDEILDVSMNQIYLEPWFEGHFKDRLEELITIGDWNSTQIEFLSRLGPAVEKSIKFESALELVPLLNKECLPISLSRIDPPRALLSVNMASQIPKMPIMQGERLYVSFRDITSIGKLINNDRLEIELTTGGLIANDLVAGEMGYIFMSLSNVQDKMLNGNEIVNTIDIRLHDPDSAKHFGCYLKAFFDNDYRVTNWIEEDAETFAFLKILRIVILSAGSLVILVATFGISTVLYLTVMERETQIAILKSLGVDRIRIAFIFLVISLKIGFFGTMFGIIFGSIGSWLVSYFQHEQIVELLNLSDMSTRLEIHDLLIVGFVTFFICIISALYPTIQAANTDPITGLKLK